MSNSVLSLSAIQELGLAVEQYDEDTNILRFANKPLSLDSDQSMPIVSAVKLALRLFPAQRIVFCVKSCATSPEALDQLTDALRWLAIERVTTCVVFGPEQSEFAQHKLAAAAPLFANTIMDAIVKLHLTSQPRKAA